MERIKDFKKYKQIGRGAFGFVYYCKTPRENYLDPILEDRISQGREVACKLIKLEKLTKKSKEYLLQEIEALWKCRHKNILRMLKFKPDGNNMYIFLDFCNGGNLRRFLHLNGRRLQEDLIRKIVNNIASGLSFMEKEKQTIHRDLKLDNILVHFPEYPDTGEVPNEYIRDFDHNKQEFEVIIADLGFAKRLKEAEYAVSCCGTHPYMAPEILKKMKYASKVDIWSIGIIIYELIVGRVPFNGEWDSDVLKQIEIGDYEIPNDMQLSKDFIHLLQHCLQYDPEERISHDELLEHPFLNKNNSSGKIESAVDIALNQSSSSTMSESNINLYTEVPTEGF
ncbi:unnamed protein product [Moneuplotes crassus]|uniref:Protein kinase domain-containing protein n=1 Tax=Euplotes crassus TaxID=5936 RepID=A0AAD1U606_EUPCR|nr:unnamed protein product [Moneuplotes crassus]